MEGEVDDTDGDNNVEDSLAHSIHSFGRMKEHVQTFHWDQEQLFWGRTKRRRRRRMEEP